MMAVLEGVANPFVDLSRRDTRLETAGRHGPTAWSLRVAADAAAVALALRVSEPMPKAANFVFLALVLAVTALSGGYRRRLSLSVLDEAPRLLLPVAVALLVTALVAPLTSLPSSLFTQAVVTCAALLGGRALSYGAIRASRRAGRLAEPTLIVGAGRIGVELCKILGEHTEYGLAPVGVIDDVPAHDALPLIGSVSQLDRVIDAYDVRRVIVAFGPTGEQEMVPTMRAAALLNVEVYVVPRFFELGLAPSGPDIESLWGIPVYRVRRAALREAAFKIKRAVDVFVAATALVVLAPVMGAIALAVRLSSPGPVLFRQIRVGQHGRLIEVLKFRTLRVNTDSDITWSVEDDPRQTWIGKWLRRLSLDEMPQLFNVLKGDMTLVGPRPERPVYVKSFSAQIVGYGDRHRLPVGLTGYAQVHGLRGDTSIEERARFDNTYIEHWSFWQDIKIVLRTAGAVGRDAVNMARRQGEEGEREEQAETLRASRAEQLSFTDNATLDDIA